VSRPTDNYQVLIIGAGPAGTAAAMHLQKNGISTCLCDKAAFPRVKSCGGLLEEAAFKAVAHTAAGALLARFSEVDIRMPQGPLQQVESATVLIDRSIFDMSRLAYCRKLGVTIKEGYAAISIRQDQDRVVTSFRNGGKIHAHAVIAADGSGSLARSGFQLPSGTKAVTMQTEMPAGPDRPQRPLIRFFADNPGYGWIFPGKDQLNVGVYSLHNRGVQTLFQTFLETNGLPQCPGRGSFVLLRGDSAAAGRGRILLAGDAAGLANPLTGGGLQAALYSGRAAALSLLHNNGGQALPHYQQLLDRVRERPFGQLAFARLFYQEAKQHQSYQESLAFAEKGE
jgi:geranylgeranyl reductase family protein